MSSSEYTRGSPSDCEDRISPRRAHCPIVVPDTPASSPTSPARKVPWALGLATTALKVCTRAADERPRAATIARAPVDRDVAQSSVGVEPRGAGTPLARGSLYDARRAELRRAPPRQQGRDDHGRQPRDLGRGL